MTVKAAKFTPEVMISAPRRSAGIPNHDASLVLYTESTYSFSEHKKKTEIRCLATESNESHLIDDRGSASDPVWLEGDYIALFDTKKPESSPDDADAKTDTTYLVIGRARDFAKSAYVAGEIPAAASNLKITKLGDKRFGVAFSATTNPDGSLHTPSKTDNKKPTARYYTSIWVRHWDKWLKPSRNSLFYAALYEKKEASAIKGDTSYSLSTFTNALRGTALESPIPPFGGTDHFDISPTGLVFIAKDPQLNPALNTKCNLYTVLLSNFVETTPQIYSVDMGSFQGAMTSPRFSKDGSQIVFLTMKKNGYEADKNEIFLVSDVNRLSWVRRLAFGKDSRDGFSPSDVCFSDDGKTLLFTADVGGSHDLATLPLVGLQDQQGKEDTQSRPVTAVFPGDDPFSHSLLSTSSSNPLASADEIRGSISSVHALPKGKVFFSGSSFVDSSFYGRTEIDGSGWLKVPSLVSSATNNGAKYGLARKQVDSFNFTGVDGGKVHAHLLRPSDFDSSKRYPLAFVVHGGPQAAWNDEWGTRWNASVLAEAGYVVVLPNPTGSTGYGQHFVDAIKQQWGGKPYHDLELCFKAIEDRFDYIDTSNAVALGASYGGFSMNWMNGHALGKKFKALVTHDGIFSTRYALATEELYFPNHDLGGPWTPSNKKSLAEWDKWDPSLYSDNWTTPNLVIHSTNDYRLTEAEGLATFNILQQRGIKSAYLSFPDENHWVVDAENSLIWHKAVFNWINSFTGLPVEEGALDEVIMDPERPGNGEKRAVMLA